MISTKGEKPATPSKPQPANMVLWPEVVPRLKRGIEDCGLKVVDVDVGTTPDGMEAVIVAEVSGLPRPHNATVHVGCVVGRPEFRGCHTYGGVVQGGVPCVLGEYGSYRQGTTKTTWGISLDACVHRFVLDSAEYRKYLDELRSRFVGKRDFDSLIYRALVEGMIKVGDVELLHELRRPEGESLWDAVRAVNVSIARRKPIRYNPRLTQLGQMWQVTKMLRESWEARTKKK